MILCCCAKEEDRGERDQYGMVVWYQQGGGINTVLVDAAQSNKKHLKLFSGSTAEKIRQKGHCSRNATECLFQ